ncbi:MAG: hypothetical protein QXG10_00330 [Candidatus Hadarchaeales archaeon]
MLPVILAILSGVFFGSWSLTLKKYRGPGLTSFFTVFFATTFLTVAAGCFIAGGNTMASLGRADLQSLIWGLGGGLGWGLATLSFGYALTLVGLALGYAIILGLGMLVGTSVSMVFFSGGMSDEPLLYGICGMLVALFGTLISSYSGSLKSGDAPEKRNFRKGIPVCIASGFLSSLFALGYGGSRPAVGTWASILLLTGGFWMAQLISLCAFIRGNRRVNSGGWRSLILPLIGGVIFSFGVLSHYASADVVGVALSYPMMMGIQIFTGNAWSMVLGEWRSAPRKALAVQLMALSLLAFASFLVGRAMGGS